MLQAYIALAWEESKKDIMRNIINWHLIDSFLISIFKFSELLNVKFVGYKLSLDSYLNVEYLQLIFECYHYHAIDEFLIVSLHVVALKLFHL